MTFKKLSKAICLISAGLNVGCGKYSIDRTIPQATKHLYVSLATVETPATITVLSDRINLKSNGTAEVGCFYQAAGGESATQSQTFTSPTIISSLSVAHANLFTPTSYMKINSMILRIRKVGGPSGNMFAQIRSSSGLDPGTALATSGDILISSVVAAASGTLTTFTLSSPYEVAAGTTYGVTLYPQSDATLDGANNFRWVTNDTAGGGCTGFPIYRASADAGSTWGTGNNLTYRRSYFSVVANTNGTPGQASWILTGRSGGIWSMASFAITENVGGISTGVVTYDVGSGSSSSTATYSQTGLTKAQVQAMTDLTGTYLYVRVNLSVSSPFFDQSSVSDGTITLK